jgi:hypothetical protein
MRRVIELGPTWEQGFRPREFGVVARLLQLHEITVDTRAYRIEAVKKAAYRLANS